MGAPLANGRFPWVRGRGRARGHGRITSTCAPVACANVHATNTIVRVTHTFVWVAQTFV